MTKRRPCCRSTSVPGLPRSSTKCGKTARDPSRAPPDRNRRPECGARVPLADAGADLERLSCASPFEPGATERPFGVGPSAAARRSAWRLKPPLARITPPSMPISRDVASGSASRRSRGRRGSRTIFVERRGRQNVHVATYQRMQQPADQRVAHHQPRAAPWRTGRARSARGSAACSNDCHRSRRRQQMADVGPVDHHAAEHVNSGIGGRISLNGSPSTGRRTATAPAPARRCAAPSSSER